MSIVIQNKSQCSGCHACYEACPKKCITMVEDAEGFLYPSVDATLCVECGLCSAACPIINRREERDLLPVSYASYNLDQEVRKNSSSGGLFYVFAEYILEKGGLVFATTMSEDNKRAIHTKLQSKEELKKACGSKYLQSTVGHAFGEIKDALKKDILVLYVGTPCQVEGLKAFLGKDYANLFCFDFICHGVPSPKLWEKYLSELESKNQTKTTQVSFRNKRYGWRLFSMFVEFEEKKEYCKIHKEDSYMRFFLDNISLRPSCYDCSVKRADRVSDFTLADFWSCRSLEPELDDDKGISLVLVHSQKGQKLLDEVKEDIFLKEVDVKAVTERNTAFLHSPKMPTQRDSFMKDMNQLSYKDLCKKYAKKLPLKTRIKLLLKKISG